MKREGETPLEPAVSEPCLAVPGPAALTLLSAIPIPSSAGSSDIPMAAEAAQIQQGTVCGGGDFPGRDDGAVEEMLGSSDARRSQ